VGTFAGRNTDPQGRLITEAEWAANESKWLPTAEDRAYVRSLMHGVYAPGKVASWVAAPAKGVDGRPVDFEYVKPPSA
jgi:benzoyl-CoA 2,3-dioxygenase component B